MRFLLILSLSLYLVGCYSYREYPVEYDYSYHGKFKKYNSYAFMDPVEEDESVLNPIITEQIKTRMSYQGYKYKEEKPNLLISYKIYYDSLNFRGYNQPDIERWVDYRYRTEEDYDPIKYDLKQGTLLIQFYDRKQDRSIWQGYATGVYGNIYFDNEKQLRVAVRSILDRYQFLAEDMKNKEFVVSDEQINE